MEYELFIKKSYENAAASRHEINRRCTETLIEQIMNDVSHGHSAGIISVTGLWSGKCYNILDYLVNNPEPDVTHITRTIREYNKNKLKTIQLYVGQNMIMPSKINWNIDMCDKDAMPRME